MNFVVKMAWRDSRRQRLRLILFMSAIVAGIAALVAVRSFSDNLRRDIDREAKTLLGADLALRNNQPIPDSVIAVFQRTKDVQTSRVLNFASMARFPKNGGTRLCQIRGIEGDYPYYGQWKTQPELAWQTFRQKRAALVDHALLLQFGLQPGDSVQIGEVKFVIEGDLLSAPGRPAIGAAILPTVFIPSQWVDSTDLVQRGSRVDYQFFFKMPDGVSADTLAKRNEKMLEAAKLDWETVESRKSQVGDAFGRLGAFLNLVGFIALLLGCIGVAGAVHVYIKDKLPTVAVLRCLGASGRQAFYVYLLQVVGIGVVGSVLGAVLGGLIQKVLPWIAKDFLPIEDVSTDLSWTAVAQGVLMGVIVAVLFALLPLAGILKTSPLRTLRAVPDDEPSTANRWLRWGVYALTAAVLVGFTRWLTGFWEDTWMFVLGVSVAFGVLWGMAKLLTWGVRRFFPRRWSYVWRQSIANLYRPHNQTVLLVVTIGLGAMLLSTLFLTQNMLLNQIEFRGSGEQPNMLVFDIQTKQRDTVAAIATKYKMPLLQQVPIVTMRIAQIEGVTKAQYDVLHPLDSTQEEARERPGPPPPDGGPNDRIPEWAWEREYRVTFRDTLISSEELIEGTWIGQHDPSNEVVKVSISDRLQDAMNAKIGTRIIFNVQGMPLETEVASVRKVDFSNLQTNFLVLFPKGVLEQAPQFHVLVSRVESAEQSAQFQSELVARCPGVSAIDLTQILKSVDEVLSKVSFVIRFMALFSILTGLLVLLSSIYQSKFARIRESVLLRTLGASRRQILSINMLEYLFLGGLACLAGVGLSVGAAWGLARFAFKIPFAPDWLPLLVTFASITGLTVILGLLNSREVVSKPPLEVLRSEG
jgi:putative ABC transport system permease protein